MDTRQRIYLCIDLKSFFASVECVERGLDPLTTDLVVADPERTEKTICLAVSPSLKAKGVRNRCRVFEIPRTLKYIMAKPRMKLYIDYSADVYAVYLKYLSKDDIYVYSIDEAFLDVTDYLAMYGVRARILASMIMKDILRTVGITATCGIGTNLYLAKIALDISAKHARPDENGVRMGMLTEKLFQQTLWDHQPLTDFWRIGPGISARLERLGIKTMRQLAGFDEDLLYDAFGVDAELMIDHAWGREPVTMKEIKAYKPSSTSLSSGQVLAEPRTFDGGLLIVKEMADSLCLDLGARGLATGNIGMYLWYASREEFHRQEESGSAASLSSSGSYSFDPPSNSPYEIIRHVQKLYEKTAHRNGLLRGVNLSFGKLLDEEYIKYDLFTDPEKIEKQKRLNQAVVSIKEKYGKNSIIKAMSLEEGASQIERNSQIGGHKA